MIPYTRHRVEYDDIRAVGQVLSSDHLAQGPEAIRFEAALARRVEADHAVSVSSGTAALHLALAALGIGPGDEVIVPSLTFVATANAVLLCGAKAVFADVDADSLCLDPEAVAQLRSPRTRAVIPVHFGGRVCDMAAIREAVGPTVAVVEDACHALGADRLGRPAGGIGDLACFSFHPAKHITTGEGGAVTCRDPVLARKVVCLREHGIERSHRRFQGLGLPPALHEEQEGPWVYEQHGLSGNHRLSEVAAALGRSQLARLDAQLERRRALAARYREALSAHPCIELPAADPQGEPSWHLYPIRLNLSQLRAGRAHVFKALRARGIGVQVHYIPVHLQPFYRKQLGTGFGDLPVTEAEYLRLISIPLHPGLTDWEVQYVIESLAAVVDEIRR